MIEFEVRSEARDECKDITGLVQRSIAALGVEDGICLVYIPHTTAAVTINETADPDVIGDILQSLDQMFPWNDRRYSHREGNSAAHIKASLMGSSVTVPVHQGQLAMGTWQGILFCEFDGPRTRQVRVQVV